MDLHSGLEHLDRAIADYDPEAGRSGGFRLGNDPGVPVRTTAALVLWMLGFADRAVQRADEAVALAKRLDHPYSAAYAAFHAGLLHLWLRDPGAAEEYAEDALRIGEAHGFAVWGALALCLRGAALTDLDRGEEGLAQIGRGLALYRRLKTPPVFWPLLLLVCAQARVSAGKPEEASDLLDEALAIGGPGAEDSLTAEMCRLKGEVLLAASPNGAEAAEPWLRRAFAIAQARGARTFELRAAIALSRLGRRQGDAGTSRRALADAYGRLTEGFATADAREAQGLLADPS
jgi:tetratricopeptide (TPR) repeat protein